MTAGRTAVFFHAHPDDEAIATGGTMARAAAEGHRVVLVVATDGDHGEAPDDLADDETLVQRRRAETAASAAVLGVERVVHLGFRDSGMTGWDANADPAAFCRADLDVAAELVAAVLREEGADVLTVYDWHGTYGHPDHVQVHRVGVRAGEMVPGVRVLQVTANRDAMARMIDDARERDVDLGAPGDEQDFDPHGPADDGNPFGEPEAALTLAVDVRAWVGHKRRSIACHRSQISDSSFFLEMPEDAFAEAFGTEWYIEPDTRPPYRWGWIFAEPGDGTARAATIPRDPW